MNFTYCSFIRFYCWFFKCYDNVVIFRFSFYYRKFVTLIIPWWLMHCLLSGRDFVPTLWYFFVFFTYYRKFVTLIIPWWLIHCLLSGVDFIILMWYYLFSLLIIGSSWHWLFCGDWCIVCWVEWILSSSSDTIIQDLCWNSSRNMWCCWS